MPVAAVAAPSSGRTKIPIRQGYNVWRLLRTDRDAASAGEIPQMAAAVVRYFIRGLEASGQERGPLYELTSTAPNEWRFGWVRPLKVLSVSQSPQAMPAGIVLADRHKTVKDTIPTVRGQKPWYVLVGFWWRAPDALIDYPGLREGLFGRSYELDGADWTLDSATTTAGKDPGDQTWTQAQGAAAGKLAREAGAGLGAVLGSVRGIGVLVLLYLISRKL
jgi:hypothetical protein